MTATAYAVLIIGWLVVIVFIGGHVPCGGQEQTVGCASTRYDVTN